VTPIAPAPIGAREFDVRFAPFAFATVEDDPDIAGVREQSAELLVPIQAPAGDDEDEHARDATSDAPARQPRSRSKVRAVGSTQIAHHAPLGDRRAVGERLGLPGASESARGVEGDRRCVDRRHP
jgi:hypothetical protein